MKKQQWFPLLTYESKRLNHFFAILLSGLATFGISVTHTGTPLDGGQIILHMPPLAVLLTGIGHWIQQYILAKGAYTALQSQLNPLTSQPPTPVVVVPGSHALTQPVTQNTAVPATK